MARSDHARYTADERYERRENRRHKRPIEGRRQRTRSAIIAAALTEVTR